jgi:hypothetical protein
MRIPRRLSLQLKTLSLLTLAALSTLAAAQDDVPGRVGRVALAQGPVSIGNDAGAEMSPAQVNWPVTSGTVISTARGARTELRIGSTSIRLDGDSSLEVTQLDDANLRLRLDYGSASVRVLDPDALAGFELATPEARVRLPQPARVRVDAERVRDTSAVEVFEGVATVDGGGSELTLRAGKGAELTDDDVRTMLAQGDAFDDWSLARDRADANAASARYVGTDMTGYEDLDRYGSWQEDNEYGPLWTPVVPAAWVPYSDGSWVWLDPWGWTWVDDAPWGYAPFHYGRWVYVRHHWSWAPGHRHEHPVWAPALVGWVGGAGWNITFGDRGTRPASGWYPLTPHDRFVPNYRTSENHLRWMNKDVRPDPQRPRDFRPQGLTVVPQDRFSRPGRVDVAHAPHVTPAAVLGRNAPVAAGVSAPPPPPQNRFPHDERVERFARGQGRDPGREHGFDTSRLPQDGFIRQTPVLTSPPISGQPAQPLGVISPTPHQPQQALGVISPTPHQPPQGLGVNSPTPHLPPQGLGVTSPAPRQMTQPPIVTDPAPQPPAGWQRNERREQFEEQRREQFEQQRRGGQSMQAPVAQPAPQAALDARVERMHRGEWERPREAASAPVQAAPRPMPAPVMAAPAPQPVRPVAPAPAPQHGGGEQHAHNEQHGQPHQQER